MSNSPIIQHLPWPALISNLLSDWMKTRSSSVWPCPWEILICFWFQILQMLGMLRELAIMEEDSSLIQASLHMHLLSSFSLSLPFLWMCLRSLSITSPFLLLSFSYPLSPPTICICLSSSPPTPPLCISSPYSISPPSLCFSSSPFHILSPHPFLCFFHPHSLSHPSLWSPTLLIVSPTSLSLHLFTSSLLSYSLPPPLCISSHPSPFILSVFPPPPPPPSPTLSPSPLFPLREDEPLITVIIPNHNNLSWQIANIG